MEWRVSETRQGSVRDENQRDLNRARGCVEKKMDIKFGPAESVFRGLGPWGGGKKRRTGKGGKATNSAV